ncbi:uncharacterized protein LOC116624984 [Phoca vitulina]|uniref:uncharacterized protein LOC116624984 n=1 Tax=Phoca vitulina TaxID=9720 RepID=UPI001395F24C|nr:uncharacterized protein LOC116624984 [Phoca vitulina]
MTVREIGKMRGPSLNSLLGCPVPLLPSVLLSFHSPVLLFSQVGFLHHSCAGAEAEHFSDSQQVGLMPSTEDLNRTRRLNKKELLPDSLSQNIRLLLPSDYNLHPLSWFSSLPTADLGTSQPP